VNLHLIAAALPPVLDGIGDYTANLAGALVASGRARVTVVTGEDQAAHAPIRGVSIVPTFSAARPGSVRRIADHIAAKTGRGVDERPDWVVLQYNPFSYGRWGLNPYLPWVMRRVRRRGDCAGSGGAAAGPRVALMVHEPFVPVISAKFALMTTWQRWQLWMLGRTADVVFFSIQPWADRFRPWFPGKPVLHLPVGSNVPRRVPITRTQARARLNIANETVTLGLFGNAHPARMMDAVSAALNAVGRRTSAAPLLLYMGPHGAAIRAALTAAARPGDCQAIIRAEGPLPADEISRRFAALDAYLVPFVDGISTRRTTLMTGLQHGVPIVGTRGPLTDKMLEEQNGTAFLLSCVSAASNASGDVQAFGAQVVRVIEDAGLQARLGQGAQQLYEREFAWERVAGRLLGALETFPQAGTTRG